MILDYELGSNIDLILNFDKNVNLLSSGYAMQNLSEWQGKQMSIKLESAQEFKVLCIRTNKKTKQIDNFNYSINYSKEHKFYFTVDKDDIFISFSFFPKGKRRVSTIYATLLDEEQEPIPDEVIDKFFEIKSNYEKFRFKDGKGVV